MRMTGVLVRLVGLALAPVIICTGAIPVSSQSTAAVVEYRDPGGRFRFSYPPSFGSPEAGTDSGFANRLVAIRFSTFSAQGIGGEAVLNVRRPALDVLAAGGLYDEIASGTLPSAISRIVDDVLPRLSAATVCEQLGREQHVDISSPPFAALSLQHRTALAELDRMGNHAPRMTRCAAEGDVVVFDKDSGMTSGGARRRSYGAVKFMTGRYAAFQIVRAGGLADATVIEQMRQIVASFRMDAR